VEPYYEIQYESETFDKDFIEELKNQKADSAFLYPQKNPFLPDQLDLVCSPQTKDAEETESVGVRHYAQTDTELEIPRGSLSLSIISNAVGGDPRNYLMAKLFTRAKKEELNEWGYIPRLAGLSYNISHGYNTLTLDVSGYSQHLTDLLENLILDGDHKRRIDRVQIDEKTFEQIKEKFKKSLMNRAYDAAYQQLLYEVSHVSSSASIHWETYIKEIDGIGLKDIQGFGEEFFKNVAIRTYSFGNIETNAIHHSVEVFLKELGSKLLTEEEVEKFENKYPVFPKQSSIVQFQRENNNNAQISFYNVDEWTIENQATMMVIGKLIEQSYFTELRTHQQLGYVVTAFPSSGYGFTGLGTLIQSETHSATDIFKRSHDFLCDLLPKLVNDVRDEDVEAIKKAIVSEISQKPNSMGERLSRFTQMAGTYHGDFKFYEKLQKHIESLSGDTIRVFVKNKMLNFKNEGVFSMLFNSQATKEWEWPDGFQKVEDFEGFKSSLTKIQPYKKSKGFN
ncbi:MAG: insulinase family protein, partial [Pseudomonadota bacterium]